MKNVIIRKILESDIPEIADIEVSGWNNAYKGIIDDNFLKSMNKDIQAKRLLKSYKNTEFIVALLEDEVVGFCKYVDSNKFTITNSKVDCELLALYVKPDLKFTGIGSKLFSYVVTDLKRKKKKKMILWCLKNNFSAIKFYEKMGGILSDERIIELDGLEYKEVSFLYEL